MQNNTSTVIKALSGPLKGKTSVPGDKSISHRAVLFSAMAEGVSEISGLLDSADVLSSVRVVEQLGAQVSLKRQADKSLSATIKGWGSAGPQQPDDPLDCGNSGTTARLLMGLCAPWDIEATITGDASLLERPMRRITAPLMKMGVRFSPEGQEHLPITIKGTKKLKAIDYQAPMASAQLKTAVLLAGVFAQGTTVLTEPSRSRNHTELMLPEYGVTTTASELRSSVTGPQNMCATHIYVPGDPSSAAFIVCAAVLKEGSTIEIEGVSLNTARTGFIRTLERMGADISVRNTGSEGKEPYGTIQVRYDGVLRGCEVPADKIPSLIDEVPVLSLVAAFSRGLTVFRGVDELRHKEADRLRAIVEGLGSMGVDAWLEGADLFIEGQPGLEIPHDLVFNSQKDHRLAMTWALVGFSGKQSIEVKDFDSVKISYPRFLQDIERLSL